jgi:hypothetical protein
MSLKRLGVALVASLALAAVFASSAFATATTTNSHWNVAETTLANGETREVKCSRDGAANFVLTGTVAGSPAKITATTLECPTGDVIKQEGEHSIATGTLKFSGLTVDEPAGCSTSASITTKALTAKILMEGTTVYTQFEPTAGATGTFASIPLTGCAAEGTYPVKGTSCGLVTEQTGMEKANQTLTFSETIQNTAGCSLTLASNPAQITGAANNELVSGKEFSSATTTRGSWTSLRNYFTGNTVESGGKCYQASANNVGKDPATNNPPWTPITCP